MNRQPTEVNAWDRFVPVWHLLFYGMLALATVITVMDGDITIERRWLAVGVSALMAGWYWYRLLTRRQQWGHLPSLLLYFGVALALGTILVSIHPIYLMALGTMYGQVYAILPLPWAVVGAAIITLLMVGRVDLLRGRFPEPGNLLIGVMTVLFSSVLGWYIGLIITQSRDRQRLIEELEATRRDLALSERQAGMLEERQRLAREIHDTLAQGFTSIVMHLEAAEQALPNEAVTARHYLDQARTTARDSLAEARQVVWALRPDILEQTSLVEALTRVVNRWSAETSIAARLTVTGEVHPLHPSIEVTLLRVTQEALANVRKHAEASAVTVTVSFFNDQVALDVHDNGVGFDPATVASSATVWPHLHGQDSHFGLTTMRERVEELGGHLLVESAPGEGTTVVVEIPMIED